ncbi:hypothetical protein KAH94_03790 [bacterium]|nr:hypothetical protein [bacterium]
MKLKSFFKLFQPAKFATLKYQIVFVALSAIFCAKLFHDKATGFTSTDPQPEFKVLTPDSVRTFLGSSVGAKVETGIHVENFQEFDMRRGRFNVDLIVWFRFNPSVISLETIGKFRFEKGIIKKISKPRTKLIDGIMLARYDVQLIFTTNLNHKLFPFNDHRIFITLANKKVSPGEMVFESYESDLSLSKNMIIAGWKKTNHAVTTGYTEAVLDRHDESTKVFHPVAVFSIDFDRIGARDAFILLLPLFLVMYVSLIGLTFSSEDYGTRLGIATGNIAALLSYRFVIEGVAPKVGYFMLTDHIFNLFLTLSFIIMFISISLRKKEFEYLRGIILMLLHAVHISMIYYLVTYWMAT